MDSRRFTTFLAFLFAFGLQLGAVWLLIAPNFHPGSTNAGNDDLFEFMMITGVVGLLIVAAVVLAVLAALAVMVATSAAFAYLVRCMLFDTFAASKRALAWFGLSLLPPLLIGGSVAWRAWGKG